jgi:hypothetical protein
MQIYPNRSAHMRWCPSAAEGVPRLFDAKSVIADNRNFDKDSYDGSNSHHERDRAPHSHPKKSPPPKKNAGRARSNYTRHRPCGWALLSHEPGQQPGQRRSGSYGA